CRFRSSTVRPSQECCLSEDPARRIARRCTTADKVCTRAFLPEGPSRVLRSWQDTSWADLPTANASGRFLFSRTDRARSLPLQACAAGQGLLASDSSALECSLRR